MTSANHSAEELRSSSVTYATDVLKYVETNMENMLDTLKKNRQSLIDSNTQLPGKNRNKGFQLFGIRLSVLFMV